MKASAVRTENDLDKFTDAYLVKQNRYPDVDVIPLSDIPELTERLFGISVDTDGISTDTKSMRGNFRNGYSSEELADGFMDLCDNSSIGFGDSEPTERGNWLICFDSGNEVYWKVKKAYANGIEDVALEYWTKWITNG